MKRILLKFSGKSLESLETNLNWKHFFDVCSFKEIEILIVHGAGKQIDEWMNKLNIEPVYIDGKRVTAEANIDIVLAVQNGLVNSKIVKRLSEMDVKTISLSSFTNKMFIVEKRDPVYGMVGQAVKNKNLQLLENFLKEKYTPVISSLSIDNTGSFINVNADDFVGSIAKSCKFDSIYFLSDVEGVLYKNNVVNSVRRKEIEMMIDSGDVTGGMTTKLRSCSRLLNFTGKVWIGPSEPSQLLKAIEGKPVGTYIY